jgi:hypothetical protein
MPVKEKATFPAGKLNDTVSKIVHSTTHQPWDCNPGYMTEVNWFWSSKIPFTVAQLRGEGRSRIE